LPNRPASNRCRINKPGNSLPLNKDGSNLFLNRGGNNLPNAPWYNPPFGRVFIAAVAVWDLTRTGGFARFVASRISVIDSVDDEGTVLEKRGFVQPYAR
jgi:hypothetical protein